MVETGNGVVLLRLEEWGDPAPRQAREFLGVPLPKHWEVGAGPRAPGREFPKPIGQIGYTHAKSLCELEFFPCFGIPGVGWGWEGAIVPI